MKINYMCMYSVKPFQSKNRDKIEQDATNPNLKKSYDRDFRDSLTYKLLCEFIGWKVHRQNFIRAL